jgi:antitoxin component YwqK of YwqJK toxin-antitoxin module
MLRFKWIIGVVVGAVLIFSCSPFWPFQKNYKTRQVIVSTDTSQIKVPVLHHNPSFETEDNCFYYWYDNNAIHKSQGGFDGLLLNGQMKEFSLNDDLNREGHFKAGAREGKWRHWHKNGYLQKVQEWQDGKKDGELRLYNKEGQLVKKAEYKNDKLHGEMVHYNEDGEVKDKVKYKKGEKKEKTFKLW